MSHTSPLVIGILAALVGCSPPTSKGSENDPSGATAAGDSGSGEGGGSGDDGGDDGTTSLQVDDDGDGFTEEEGDCDDTDAARHPAASEVCNEGIDDDCDGLIDDSDDSIDRTSMELWFRDYDGDGFGDFDADLEACDRPEGYVLDSHDCDDNDADIHPEADEVCGNTRDEDCSGTVDDRDLDGDGHLDPACGGLDCDDAAASTYPGADDTWYDGIDSDCTGNDDYDADADGFQTTGHGGLDCVDGVTEAGFDDANPAGIAPASIFPGSEDTWYDGTDQDCSGNDDYDADADGFTTVGHGGTDCVDGVEESGFDNPNVAELAPALIHPSATETWYDGTDQDCAGDDDYDYDGDGYQSRAVDGLDCNDGLPSEGYDDSNPAALSADAVNPAATETWYDGTDQDCDGSSDYDADVDGFDSDAYGGTDCDDTDSAVSPDAADAFDGVDNNCDGTIDAVYLSDVSTILVGDATGDSLGIGLAAGGDFDGDGVDDLLVGASGYDDTSRGTDVGAIIGMPTSIGSSTTPAGLGQWTVTGQTAGDTAGVSVDYIGDADGDGIDDIVTGAPGHGYAGYSSTGEIFINYGTVTAQTVLRNNGISTIRTNGYEYGSTVIGPGDVDGNGYADILVGTGSTSVYLLYGAATGYGTRAPGSGSTSACTTCTSGYSIFQYYTMSSSDSRTWGGSSVSAAGDVDGDGTADFIVGHRYTDLTGSQTGGAFMVLETSTSPPLDLESDADATYLGASSGDQFGSSLSEAGDLNADGYDDVLVAAPNRLSSTIGGSVYVVFGTANPPGGTATSTMGARIDGHDASLSLGQVMCPAGDFNGDGDDDIILASTNADLGASNGGAAFVVAGPLTGTMTTASAIASVLGDAAGDGVGTACEPVGDTDSDGFDDFVVGADTSQGSVLYVFGAPL